MGQIILWNLLSLLIGFFLGNRLALDRDKRREFNNLIDPIRHFLLGISKNIPVKNLGRGWNTNLLLIRERLHPWKRRGFDRAVKKYNEAYGPDNMEPNGMGGFNIKENTLIAHTAKELLKFLKPR